MEHPTHESQLQRYLSLLGRGKNIILAVTLAATLLSAFYTFLAKPIYESTARVLIDAGEQASISFGEHRGIILTNKITNELENLRSYSMAEDVAKAIMQRQFIDSMEATPISLLNVADGANQDAPATLSQLTETVTGLVDFVPTRDSDIIKIIARGSDPREAALLANTFAEVYSERNMHASRARSKAVREFLETQLRTEHAALDTAEQDLQSYMRRSGMVSLEGEAKRVTEQLSELEAKHDAIGVEITSRMNTIESYKQELAAQEPNFLKSVEQSNDAYIRILQDQLASLEVQRDVTIAQNPELVGKKIYSQKLKDIDDQIATMRKNLQERTREYLVDLLPGEGSTTGREAGAGFLSRVKQKIIEQQIELNELKARKEALQRVINGYDAQFSQIPRKSVQLAKLQRSALGSEKLYMLLKEKFNEVAIAEKSEFGNVNIIDRGVVAHKPVRPIVWLNLALGFLIGLFMGIAVVFLRADLDTRVRSPEDLKGLGYPPLSTIGQIPIDQTNGTAEALLPESGSLDQHLITFHNPLSPISESYRYLQTRIQFAEPKANIKTVMVTSPNPSEGKSTTVANLAIAFAEAEKNVLLVDADLRRPSLHKFFRIEKEPGLTDLLRGMKRMQDVLHRHQLPHLDVIVSGTTVVNSSGILGSTAMLEFLDKVQQSYDIVLFDSAPLHAVTDAVVLATRLDGTIVLASAGVTKIPSFERGIESLKSMGGKLLGVVLNNYDVRKAFRGAYGDEGYGYYSYGYSHSSNGRRRKRMHAEGVR